jgi:hypothetical protein
MAPIYAPAYATIVAAVNSAPVPIPDILDLRAVDVFRSGDARMLV